MTRPSETKLSGMDFMMMDIHRPLTNDEIDEINPQAAVDKTIGAEQKIIGDETSVDRILEKCEFCFGPRPCPDHPNVEPLNVITSHDISPTLVLAGAHAADLEHCTIVGVYKDGREYFASSVSDAAESIYYLQRGIHRLNKIVDEGLGTNEHPDAA